MGVAALLPVVIEPRSLSQKRTLQGARTRALILDAAVKLASVAGLESLTIGQLATQLKMSKSGLFAHFQSKEDLQLSAVQHAYVAFRKEVVDKANARPPGIERLIGLCRQWMRYGEAGCFFVNASVQYEAREGPVRDAIVGVMDDWRQTIKTILVDCKAVDHLASGADIDQLVFELVTLFVGSHVTYHLHRDRRIGIRLKSAVLSRISQVAGAKLEQGKLKWFQSGDSI
jgi:AcrR family transcriptional regulator